MLKRLVPLLLAIGMLATLPVRSAEEPFTIYALISLSGPGSFVGRGEVTTFAAAEKYTNTNGGIRGRPVHFEILDDQSNPALSVQLANQIFAKHVAAFIGPGFGATCTAVLPLLTNGPVGYCLSNVIHPPNGSYAFSANPSTKDFTHVGFRWLMAKGVRKLALLTSTDSSGQDGEQVALENLKQPEFKDLQLVANEHFAVSDLTVAAQLTRIKAAGAQAIDAWTTGSPFGTVLRGAAENGYDGIIMTNAGNMTKVQMNQYAQYIPKTMIISGPPIYPLGEIPSGMRLARATWLDALHLVNVADPDLSYFTGWDPALIVIEVYRRIGTEVTAVQFRDYLLKMHGFWGTNGLYDFRRGDQRGIDPNASVNVMWDKAKNDFVTVSKPGGLPL